MPLAYSKAQAGATGASLGTDGLAASLTKQIQKAAAENDTEIVAVMREVKKLLEKRLTNPAAQGIIKYSPDQPRDEHGRWVSGGASSSGTATSTSTGYTRPALQLSKAEYAKVMSAINTVYNARYKGKRSGIMNTMIK